MKDQYVIIDLRNMDFMKNEEGTINYYDTMDDACSTCGMYEFEDAWVMKLMYNHIEDEIWCNQTKTKKMNKKAKEVFVRLGFEDIVVTKEESENGEYNTSASYLIGYEDEDGEECEEDGTYLKQTNNG